MSNHTLHIRPYHKNDQPQLINLLQLNTPKYFSQEEEIDFIHYLEKEREDYFVVEISSKIVGCGGINTQGNIGILSWAFLHLDFQQQGIGGQLLKYRIQHLLQQKNSSKIQVRTSQLVEPFYRKNGFQLIEIKKDYWAKGFDLYFMEYQKQLLK
ncbi:GNAT family N-acetyltransferase [Mesonia sp. K4-1]|uniref:GNAT family N-acetyltransferase n=1 Tax=Mesonia sp. K4-1 TaxID=2602760 RepID=UPI0011CCB709|nr:GNAT family N-acetyltransferase [Mesonia sp. K4-1]TXK78623.1 GNAT family N-acetyltransferase [Mesonia sp. K4-1]